MNLSTFPSLTSFISSLAVCFLLALVASVFDDGVDFGKGFEKATPDKMIIVPRAWANIDA